MKLTNDLPMPILTVTALNSYLKEVLDSDEILQDLWVRGEISNFSQPRSGHLYFSLKDSEAQMRCVMWKGSALRLRFEPRDGQMIEAHGVLSVYPAGGQVQIYVDSMRPAGEGQLYQEFLRLKAKLELEGLFDPQRKREIPPLPRHIGVITSATGAAWQDIQNTIARRMPLAGLTLAPSAVQGVDAVPGLLRALTGLNKLTDLDVILLARGGGSIEDLWAFNDEGLARAIASSRVPVISGVGHETDFTIADFVADLRAPTPTAAAELATKVSIQDLANAVEDTRLRLSDVIQMILNTDNQKTELARAALKSHSPQQKLNHALQRQDELHARLERAFLVLLQSCQAGLRGLDGRLNALNPRAVLSRGYAIVSTRPEGGIISRADQSHAGQKISIQWADGSRTAQISLQIQED